MAPLRRGWYGMAERPGVGMLGDSIRRRRRGLGAPPPPRRRPAPRPRWGRRLTIGLGVVLGTFILGYGIAALLLYPPPSDSSEPGVEVPELVGETLEVARLRLERAGLELGDLTELPLAGAPNGVVVAQSTLGGQRLPRGSTVGVGIARRARDAPVPHVVGLPSDVAVRILDRLGLRARRSDIVANAPAGQVLRVEPRPGASVPVPGPVTLVVSSGPPATAIEAPRDTGLVRLPPLDTTESR